MKRIMLILMLTLAVASGVSQSAAQRAKPANADAPINDQAMAALNRMANYLKTLKSFEISSESSRDEIVDGDMKIQKNASNTVVVQLPDRLHARVQSDDHDLQFIYNGQTLTLFSSKQKYYATTVAPPTVSRTLDAIRARTGIVFPLADVIQIAAGENLLQDITEAGYIGTSRVDGTECDHVAIRQPDVDWQVWIERGQRPVPRKLVITSKKQPTQPQYATTLSWNLSPSINPIQFTFNPPSDAVRIQFARSKNPGSQQ
jgi:hypothetical protein